MSVLTETAIVIRLPLPRDLLPNNRSNAHWAPPAKLAARWRESAGWALLLQHPFHRFVVWPAARLDIEWRCAGRPPDPDNCIAALRPIINGIADTGIVSDDRYVSIGTVTATRVTRADEELVLTLTRVEAT